MRRRRRQAQGHSNEDGRIEIEFEVDVNRNNQRWNVVIKRNGAKVYSATKRTAAPSGSFRATS